MSKMKIPRDMRKYKVNDDFFDHDTEASFYWAGFIAADGCVYNKVSKYSVLKVIELRLASADYEHLELYRSFVAPTKPIYETLIDHKFPSASVAISSPQIFNKLDEKFGIHPQKTKSLIFPDYVKNHILVNHFLRGYFDGDGGYTFQSPKDNKKQQAWMGICGTISFLESYLEILKSNGCSSKAKPALYNGQGRLVFCGNRKCKEVSDILYKDATIYMPRKYNQYQKCIELYSPKLDITKERLIELFMKYNHKTINVANEIGCSQPCVSLHIKKFGLEYLYSRKTPNSKV